MESRNLVTSWLKGRATINADLELTLSPRPVSTLAQKLRRAYDWIAQQVLVGPYHDLQYGEPVAVGTPETTVELGSRGFSSYVLLPLLNLVTSQRLLFVGAPGRGKTTMATLIGLLAGASPEQMRRSIQHGHPQLTLTDLLGSPLPSELIRAEDARAIKVGWRAWLTQRVKVIDEYNRIPTKTQSALLSLMADGYAEMFEQVVECGRSAWFLTANDEQGGGTFPVIEALKDRIDIVVRSPPFNSHHLDALERRVAESSTPGQVIPRDVVFTAEELDQLDRAVRAVEVPAEVRAVLGFFAGQLDFCVRASQQLEFMSKDTLHLAGRRVAHVCNEECPLDKQSHLCAQTENGVSARVYLTTFLFAKAMAYFRGEPAVSVEDLRQLLPWVLHERLKPNPQSAFFQSTEHQVFLTDRVGWIRQLFDKAVSQHAAYAAVRAPVAKLKADFDAGFEGLSPAELRKRAAAIQQAMEDLIRQHELSGPVHEDVVLLKGLHTRYQNHLRALERRQLGTG